MNNKKRNVGLVLLGFIACLYFIFQNKKLNEVEYKLSPTYGDKAIFTINLETATLTYQIYKNHYFWHDWKIIEDTISYKKENNFKRMYFEKTINIDVDILNTYRNEIKKCNGDSNIYHVKRGNGCQGGAGFKIQKNFYLGSPFNLISNYSQRNKESVLEYHCLDPLFELANKTIKNKDRLRDLEKIQGRFSYLSMRETNKSPFTFRYWEETDLDAEKLVEFNNIIKTIPKDSPIVFDFQDASYYFYPDSLFYNLSNRNPVYVYGLPRMMRLKRFIGDIDDKDQNLEPVSERLRERYFVAKKYYNRFKNDSIISYFDSYSEIIFELNK